MVALIAAALMLAPRAAGDADSPNIWLATPGGKLTRAGREADPLQVFDIAPRKGARAYRGRQIAFTDGGSIVWITRAGGINRTPTEGKRVVGWRDTEPLLWDGTVLASVAGVKVPMELRADDTPVFAAFFGDSGTVVSQTSAGSIRIAVTGSPPFAADFGKWKLVEARMVTATSGYLLLEGEGSAVLRIAKGRADIVAMDRVRKLGIALASDGQAYVTRLTEQESDTPYAVTDILKVGLVGPPEDLCRITGHIHVIDLDPKKMCVYGVAAGEKDAHYARFSYRTDDPEAILQSQVEFVTPAFGGPGFVSEANPN